MKVKKNKWKTISRCYKKSFSRSLSNCSLSQLLHTASLKKRINDLSRNNRLLTTALQESRIETAIQSNLLKNYAKDSNQILFARIKLNEMAKNLAKFATDLEEVRSYLDVSLPSDYDFFQKKGSCNGRIIKGPDVSCIDEAPELSENDVTACENSSDILQDNFKENVGSVNQDTEMTSILFVDDVEEIHKKRSNDKGSSTPELNLDLACVKQKRSTRSKKSTPSLEKESSSLGGLVTHIRDVSTSLMHQEEDPIEMNKIKVQIPLDQSRIEKELKNLSILSFQKHPDEPMSISHSDGSSVQSSDVDINGKKSIVSNDLPCESNHTTLVCEDKKLNEDICPLQPLNNENNSSFVINLEDNSELRTSIQKENKNCIEDELFSGSDSKKLSDSQAISSLLHDIHLPEVNEYDEEIQNVGSLTFCESDDNDDEKKNTVSPFTKRSRSKKPVTYTDYFSSDDSDIDSPFKLTVEKRNRNRRIELNSTPNGKLCRKTSIEKADISSDVINEISETDYSVYNLDVSNSKKEGKKYKKKSSSVKSKNKKTNDLPKPLFQKCGVTKLKAGKFKFSKCVSPGGILKKAQSSISQACEDNRNDAKKIDNTEDDKQQSVLQTPKSESKRVSFAPTDLVCNFARMSVSKTIAENKKVRRTSKSIIDLKEIFEEKDQLKTSPISADNSPEQSVVQKLNNSVLFDLSADTEVYTFTLPSNTHFSTNDNASSKPSVSIVSEQTKLINNRNDKHVKKSPGTLNSPKNVRRLSLKQNKINHNTSQYISEKVEEDPNILLLESPMANVKPPRRKSLFKETPDDDYPSENKNSLKNGVFKESSDDLTENKNSDCLSPENKDSLKSRIFKESSDDDLKENINPSPDKKDSLKNRMFKEFSDDCLKEHMQSDDPTSEKKDSSTNRMFKESSDGDLEKNINSDHPVPEKEDLLMNIVHAKKNSPSSIQTVDIKKSSYSKSQSKAHSKASLNKNKKSNSKIKSLEHSPVLIDATNLLASTDGNLSRRRSKQVCYKEPNLHKKLRRD